MAEPFEAYADVLLTRAARRSAGEPGPDEDGAAEDRFALSLQDRSLFAAACALARATIAEAQVLALLCAVELSPERQRLVAALQDDPSQTRLHLAGLRRLLPPPHPGPLTVAEDSRLRRAALVEVEPSGPWAVRPVWAAPSVIWALCGDTSMDPGVPPDAVVLPAGAAPATDVLHLLSGADRTSRRVAAAEVIGGHGVLAVASPADRREWDALVREATLGGLSVLVEVDEEVPAGLAAALERADHLAWGVSSDGELPLDALPDVPRRDVRVADGTASQDEWLAATGQPAPPGVRLDRRQLELVALSGLPAAQGVRRLAAGHLDRLADRVRPRRGWDDVVLPPALRDQVRALVERHRQRTVVYDAWGFSGLPSRGTVALFAGPSGTGKTLTAEVVAGELGLDLFVLDLSSLLSKYLGETEKNLGALFDAAAQAECVLFFDEADALFGRRSAVTDAKDRYANVEVAYLLQRLERHDGLVLLATNLPQNIDEAFLRRLSATVDFPPPGPAERRALWQRAFPPGCPVEDLDLDGLARDVELSGAGITAAALAAAFSAATAGEPVTVERVAAAVALEYRKLGRLASA